MSSGLITVSSLPRMSREKLAGLILASQQSRGSSAQPPSTPGTDPDKPNDADTTAAPTPTPSLTIIDVRDDDHVGGHIRSSRHVPSTTLSYRLPELVRTLADQDIVVFHCSLSQQRGPGAGLGYLREKERLKPTAGKESTAGKEQEVYVLDGGFTKWQEKYGPDERLTEAWARDIWEG
ncbi:MAG: hypothetical protein M4579_007162 [Chaenotheca gracillima]|nr:MAG: hypothetical protein M4579_007162 [Chaenotheca gracillima]